MLITLWKFVKHDIEAGACDSFTKRSQNYDQLIMWYHFVTVATCVDNFMERNSPEKLYTKSNCVLLIEEQYLDTGCRYTSGLVQIAPCSQRRHIEEVRTCDSGSEFHPRTWCCMHRMETTPPRNHQLKKEMFVS